MKYVYNLKIHVLIIQVHVEALLVYLVKDIVDLAEETIYHQVNQILGSN